ncbi:hypothetical protein PG994_012049, partial [Apiospora phragmitis]
MLTQTPNPKNHSFNMDMNLPQISHDSHGPWMVWSSWALTGLASTFLVLRCYCRVTRNKSLWWDDYVLILSWVCRLISLYRLDPKKIPDVGLLAQVDLIFAIFGAAWSKTSWAITLLRLSQGLLHHAVLFIIITINITMSLSVVFNFIQCIPSRKLWEPYLEGACWPSQIVPIYSTVAGAYSGTMDIALALLPWFLIMRVNMRLAERIGVAVAMSCGLFAGATAFVKTSYIFNLGSKDPIYDTAPLVVWGHAEIAVTIVAASIPVLRVLAKDISCRSGPGGGRTAAAARRAPRRRRTSRAAPAAAAAATAGGDSGSPRSFKGTTTTNNTLSSSMATTTTTTTNIMLRRPHERPAPQQRRRLREGVR